MNCGLLGRTLGHSYSPRIHSRLGDYTYSLYEKEPEALEEFLKTGDFTGLNVTIPYKQAVIPYLTELSPIARRLGAVNTVVRRPDGSLIGHNTDFFGFQYLLSSTGLEVKGKKALVLGSGGASKPVAAALQEQGARVVIISRTGENNYENLDRHRDAALIVNATPVGMYPRNGASPLSLEGFPRLEGVLDLIYNPGKTALLLQAERRGLIAANGLLMLVAQALESAQWFLGKALDPGLIDSIHRELRNSVENLILIGMPGSGKSTVGKLLAKSLGRDFQDADRVLEEKYGPIPEIFKARGEEAFRSLETKVLEELGKQSSLVIATGGGCVTKEENYDLLHQNGRIVCLQRPLSALSCQGRPLSQSVGGEALYQQRAPLYAAFQDLAIENTGTPEETAAEILKHWEEMP